MRLLENNTAQASFDEKRGGRLSSLRVRGLELLVTDASEPLLWGCYPMAPWAGRLDHGILDFAGTHYSLPRTFVPHAIHGTTWNREWKMVNDNTMSVSLGQDWPFPGVVIHRFDLHEEFLQMRLELHAEDAPFPASLGWHPWFRRTLSNDSAATLEFDAEAMYEVNAAKIPTGRLLAPTEGPWDDCFINLSRQPTLTWPGAVQLTLLSSCDHWMLFDEPEHAICVEPMSGPPNGPNLRPCIVEPGKPLCAQFELRWALL